MKYDLTSNPKGKTPYIKHGGILIGDSALIIRYLENTFDVPEMAAEAVKRYANRANKYVPFADLSQSDQAMCDLIRLSCEGELYWSLVSIRWLGGRGISKSENNWVNTEKIYFDEIPAFIRGMITPMIRVLLANDSKAFGLARHSPADQLYLG